MNVSKDLHYIRIEEQLEAFYKRIAEKIEKEEKQLEASKKKSELDNKMAHELQLNKQLNNRLEEVSRRGDDLERICADFSTGLHIGDNDKKRLENAKEMYEIAKEMTGVRFDFSAPPDVVKGYVKSERRRLLETFSTPADSAAPRLWDVLKQLA